MAWQFEAIVDPTRQCEDGFPVNPGELRLEDIGRLAWLDCGWTGVAQCTPLATWWDGSVRLLHVIAPKLDRDANADGLMLYVPATSPHWAPPPVPDPLPAVKEALSAFEVTCEANGVVYEWAPRRFARTNFAGPYRWDFDVSGWMMSEEDKRYTWCRAWVSYRPHVAPRSLEIVLVHSNMQPHGAKRGTLPVVGFGVETSSGGLIRPGSPRAFENYPAVSDAGLGGIVKSMQGAFLPDAAAQIVHFILDLGPGHPDLYGPMRPADPERVYGYGDFDGVLPPVGEVEKAERDQPVREPLSILDKKTGQRLGQADRVVCRWFAEYKGESGYRQMTKHLDFPQLVGGDEGFYWDMLAFANDRLEDPGQRAHPSEDGTGWLEWRHPMDGGRYESGPYNMRSTGADYDGMHGAPDLRTYASGRGEWSRGSSSCQHNVVGAERQAWIRTGKDLYRELIVEKAEMIRTIPGFQGQIPFSGRSAGSCLGMALAADEADQRVERTVLGWEARQPAGLRDWWDVAIDQVQAAMGNAGLYRHDGQWRDLPAPATKQVVNLGLGSGGSAWETIYCKWMTAWWFQNVTRFAVLERVRRSMDTGHHLTEIALLARHLAATLRFQREVGRRDDGYAYKLQIGEVWTKDGKFVEAETPGAVRHDHYTPCNDGGIPTPGKWYWNSANVWIAQGYGALLFWFGEFIPPDLRDGMVADLRQLLAGHDRDNRERKRWILPLASARRVLAREDG
ncbi:MAG: hypothetical protein RL885_24985 [Planctomycetota bacterium]